MDLTYYKFRYLPWPLDSSVRLLKFQNKLLFSLFLYLESEALSDVPLCSEVGILRVNIFHMLQPDGVSENLLVLLGHNLVFTRQFELF